MLAGYALLLGEKNGMKINRGMIEYPLSGAMREVQIHEVDKARVLRIRDRIRQIKDGRLPDKPTDAPCDKCEMVDIAVRLGAHWHPDSFKENSCIFGSIFESSTAINILHLGHNRA